jgi:hypothetical protein
MSNLKKKMFLLTSFQLENFSMDMKVCINLKILGKNCNLDIIHFSNKVVHHFHVTIQVLNTIELYDNIMKKSIMTITFKCPTFYFL